MTNPMDLPFQIKIIPGKDMYIDSTDYNYNMKGKGNYTISYQGYKTRPIDINGVYKPKIMYEITIYEEDKNKIVKDMEQGIYQKHCSNIYGHISVREFFEQYLPDRNVILRNVDNIGSLFNRNRKGFVDNYTVVEGMTSKTFQFALIDDFERLPPSKKEQERININKSLIANQRMAELTVVDTIKEKLKEQGIICTVNTYNSRKGTSKILKTNDCGSYNKLVELALDYYLNDIVKDLGCILHVKPLHKNRSKPRTYCDDLVPLETIEFPTLNN